MYLKDENMIWVGTGKDRVKMVSKMENRHGLIAGATGTGKTVTLKVLSEAFSDMGVPVFLADVKGDLTGMAVAGEPNKHLLLIDMKDLKAMVRYVGDHAADFRTEYGNITPQSVGASSAPCCSWRARGPRPSSASPAWK